MIENALQKLGDKITRLRIARNLKQSELAYEAGISERTLQRMEAGEIVKSDGLLRVIAYLGRLDDMLSAIDTPSLSPYELATRPAKGRALKRTPGTGQLADEATGTNLPRARVRKSKQSNTKRGKASKKSATVLNTPGKIVWPEDQT